MDSNQPQIHDFLINGGEMGTRMRNFDWSKTPLGSPESWDADLKTSVNKLLRNFEHTMHNEASAMTGNCPSEHLSKTLFEQAPSAISIYRGPRHIVESANAKMLAFWGMTAEQIINKPFFETISSAWHLDNEKLMSEVFRTGKSYMAHELSMNVIRNDAPHKVYVKLFYEPLRGEDGAITGVMEVTDDITDQVMARKKTEESEQHLKFALDGGGLGTFDYSNQTSKLHWSAKAKHFFGLDENEEANVDLYFRAVHPEDREHCRIAAENAMIAENGGNYDNEYRVVGINNGIQRWLRSKGKVIFGEDKKPIRFTGVIQDITKNKEAEETNRMLVSIIEASHEFIGFASLDGSIRYGNPAALAMLGWNSIEGRCVADCVYPEDRPFGAKLIQQLIDKGSFEHEIRFVNEKTGIPFLMQWNAFVIKNPESGQIIGLATVSTEITERKRAEETLKESEEQFRTLVETLPQLVWITDEKGENKYTSGSWREYTGSDPGGAENWITMIHQDDVDKIGKAWSRSLSTGDIYKSEVRIKSKNDEYRWHTVHGIPILDTENKITKWVGAFTDIHSEKSFANELEKQVEARTNELEKLNTTLEAKNLQLELMNKELESFAYISSHDLQEPLRKIQTFASRIIDNESDNLTQRGKEHFKRMQDAAHRMQTLIEDLLAYSRTNTEDRTFIKTPLRNVIDEIEEEFSEDLMNRNAVIERGQMSDVNIIPFQFRQLMHNLITNALKFSKPEGQSRILIDSRTGLGKDLGNSKLSSEKMYCHIGVSDNGIGFDPDYGEKIFEVFQRLHSRDKYSGTGIGLAIVKKIVDNHNGVITATGNVNEGATFDIYIPA